MSATQSQLAQAQFTLQLVFQIKIVLSEKGTK